MQAELKGKLHLDEGEHAQQELQKEPTIITTGSGKGGTTHNYITFIQRDTDKGSFEILKIIISVHCF